MPTAAVRTGDDAGAGAHEHSEGFALAALPGPDVAGATCAAGAPVRAYDVVAIDVDITLNRYLDHDPQGRMFVLENDLDRVRAEEAQNAAARAGRAEPAVSLGLQGDAIQPLTLRVLQGECLRLHLRNGLKEEPASIHVHGAALRVSRTGAPAIATNPDSFARAGGEVTYEWMVGVAEPEGTHYFHSEANQRVQTDHGLFGAVIVEPAGSRWSDPLRAEMPAIGWAALIAPSAGPAFREFVLYYHEIGDEVYQIFDRTGQFVPQVDPFMGAYRPGARALNYRSEPFMNRLGLQQAMTGRVDESLAYSSYVFGDPATPIMRSYLGDPVKQRVVHAGAEVSHVHHVHGGSIRWRRQTGVEPSGFTIGLDKHPALVPEITERTDSQTVGPSETFDIEDECGSGGCQQSVGDFLYHCHVAHHYIGGMWGIWRVYNTLQNGAVSTDSLPQLAEVPDRAGRVAPAVTSTSLTGEAAAAIERELPPPGKPKGYDASVFNWSREGGVYVNEPETAVVWPGYRATTPGTRPPFLFEPATGRLAYPFLRPHLGARPPFSPGHNPAPYLDPVMNGDEPAAPGANGPASVCPAGTKPRTFDIHAITLPVTLSHRTNVVDPAGELYVLADEEAQVRADNARRTPLAIRANAGEDCVDVTLASELADTPENMFLSKVDLHIHFVQFDVQSSDGVITGFNFEQSIRPFALAGEPLVEPVSPGALTIRLASAERFQPGVTVGVGMGGASPFETRRIVSIDGSAVTLDQPLARPHSTAEFVSAEFARARWYPDVQFGTAYFHDHVNALASWKHGLFGALVVEPPGSSYHDPTTGSQIESGPIADIHTSGRVSADILGSFRELALFIQDDQILTRLGRSTGSSFNLRVEPLAGRGDSPFTSDAGNRDPETPLLRAYLGDPLVVRALVGATNEVHTLHIDGHTFRVEPWDPRSPPVDTVHVGISERYDLSIANAGGVQQLPGDYLYYNGRASPLVEGSWGFLRVLPGGAPDGPRPLPGHEQAPAPASTICPPAAPRRDVAVVATEVSLPMLGGETGRAYVSPSELAAVRSGGPVSPLIVHATVGDCLMVTLTNTVGGTPVGFHTSMLASDPAQNLSSVEPGHSRTYTFYASPEVGETTALVRDMANVTRNPALGLYGAIVVAPQGSTFTAVPGAPYAATVSPPGRPAYRDFTLLFEDADAAIGTHRMPYGGKVDGTVAINYRNAPLADRLDRDPDPSHVFRCDIHGDPPTPLLEAPAGEPVEIHVVAPSSEQSQVFSVEGHTWPFEAGRPGTPQLSSVTLGGMEATTLHIAAAGGPAGVPGDYIYGDHRGPFLDAGLWGILRVRPPSGGAPVPPAVARPGRGTKAAPFLIGGGIALLAGAGAALLLCGRRRRLHTHHNSRSLRRRCDMGG